MRAVAHDLAERLARRLFAPPPQALWTVTVHGRVVGLLAREPGRTRLTWFEPADSQLMGSGPLPHELLDGELEALAAALTQRLGRQVELDSLPV
jgi:hypothetical protein